MTIALTAKDKEIDRLEQAPCTPAPANGSRKGTQAR
jgi:hypothetical protein